MVFLRLLPDLLVNVAVHSFGISSLGACSGSGELLTHYPEGLLLCILLMFLAGNGIICEADKADHSDDCDYRPLMFFEKQPEIKHFFPPVGSPYLKAEKLYILIPYFYKTRYTYLAHYVVI
jgi:hypothetical protein